MRPIETEKDPAAGLKPLLDLAHDAGTGETSEAAHGQGRSRLLSTLGESRARPQRRLGRSLAALAVACALAVGALVAWPRHRLDYAVEGGAVAPGGFVAPAAGGAATLRFSEGTSITIADGGRARVAEIGPHGARLVLEDGRARVRVVHLPGAAWSIEAGPFSIAVTGTAFEVGWSAPDQTLEVRMSEGTVEIHGPAAPGGVALHAGQHLTARPSEGELRIEAMAGPPREAGPLPPTTAAVTSAPPDPSTARSAPAIVPPPIPSARPAAASTPSWSQRVAAGEFALVLAEADARGLDAVLAGAPLADLAALADAARYGGRSDLARRALGAERERFAGSREAASAAFLLGRIAEDAQGSPAAAVVLYERYLDESPAGPFAPEALGRKMVALRRLARLEAARAAAVEYLRRYPAGAYATTAGELTRAP